MLGLGLSIPQVAARGSRSLVAAIRSLFAASEPGVWYDPSDLSTLFQDTAGTTPVTGVEQPVGLMLDKSKGLVLGPELVTNGDFSNGTTGWSALFSGTVAVVNGIGNFIASGGNYSGGSQQISLSINKAHLIEFDVYTSSGGAADIRIDSVFTINSTSLIQERKRIVFYPSTAISTIKISNTVSGKTTYVDNISVRELPGNHAYQTTATSRPVLSARVNLLTKTEQFDDAAWIKSNVIVTPNAAVAPDGTTTSDSIVQSSGTRALNVDGPLRTIGVAGDKTLSIYAKQNTARYLALGFSNGAGLTATAVFDLQAGTVDGSGFHPSVCSSIVPSIEPHGNGWYRCGLSLVGSTDQTNSYHFASSTAGASGLYNRDITGDGTSGIYIWGASIVPANQSSLPYQRVNTATDYDTAGFPHYLRFDGVDDWLVTPTITPGTDKAQVFAGVRKLSDAAGAIAVEFSANVGSNAGSFYITAPESTGANGNYWFLSRGSTGASIEQAAISTTLLAPRTDVITATGDISGDLSALRVNGAANGTNGTADQGTGNFLAYPLYIGRRGGTTLPFNGHIYSLIVRFGANLPTATIANTEKYINTKTRAY